MSAPQQIDRSLQSGGYLYGGLTVVCWAGYNVAAKYGVDHGISPALMSFLRYGVVGVFLIPILLWRLRMGMLVPPIKQIFILALLSGPIFGIFAYGGYIYAPLSHGLMFAPTSSFVVGGLIGIFVLKEPAGSPFFIGTAVMLIGLVALSGFDMATLGARSLKGDMMFLIAGSLWAVSTNLMRHWRIDPIAGTVAIGSFSSVLAIPIYLIFGQNNIASIGSDQLIFQAIIQGLFGGVIAVALYIASVRALGAARASLLPAMTPGTALLFAYLIFRDTPSAAEIIGILIVSSGFVYAISKGNQTQN